MEALADFSRLSLNQITTNSWNVREAVEGCVRAGIPWIGLWREKVHEYGVAASRRLVADAGLQIASLWSGGGFRATSKITRYAWIAHNSMYEAAELSIA